ncbi:unnamed protein product [Soboliphyme baturini]|uniref:DUF5655 domain-containing protein n=1 Tax=Soboliphyme baturini TaxID=241478 RepID=A0A183I956_9BILA|nr:unnamed protein product [Soboliphyme baturini]
MYASEFASSTTESLFESLFSGDVICQLLEGLSEVLQRRNDGERCWRVTAKGKSRVHVTFCNTDAKNPDCSIRVKWHQHPVGDTKGLHSIDTFVRNVNLRKHFQIEDFDDEFFDNVLQLLFNQNGLRGRS